MENIVTPSTGVFEAFNFHPQINASVKAAGYSTPTDIQEKSIPAIISGRDVMGLAQTGTGKTAAFVLPLLQHLLNKSKNKDKISQGPDNINKAESTTRALIIVPTRELAEQVQESVRLLSAKTHIKSIAVYGGVKIDRQIKNLRRRPEIVVACPGRLMDHIRRRTINISKVDFLVLDEADQMFDMGFIKDIRSIVQALPKSRQTLMFSATMPDSIKKLAVEVLKNPVTVMAGKQGMASTVSHMLYPVKEDGKSDLLLSLLNECVEGSVLVFTRTKHRAKRLSEKLISMRHSATCLQGNLSQFKRREAMEGFRNSKYRIMVATDIAARGIDISSIKHVINYDIPDTVEAYTHRIGRTGRAAQTGSALTLITNRDESMVRHIENVLKKKIRRVRHDKWT